MSIPSIPMKAASSLKLQAKARLWDSFLKASSVLLAPPRTNSPPCAPSQRFDDTTATTLHVGSMLKAKEDPQKNGYSHSSPSSKLVWKNTASYLWKMFFGFSKFSTWKKPHTKKNIGSKKVALLSAPKSRHDFAPWPW